MNRERYAAGLGTGGDTADHSLQTTAGLRSLPGQRDFWAIQSGLVLEAWCWRPGAGEVALYLAWKSLISYTLGGHDAGPPNANQFTQQLLANVPCL